MVITARADPQAVRAYWTMSRGDSERAFRSARRHSRVVRVLRIAIPVGVLISVVGISLATYLNPLRMLASLPIDISDMVVSGTKITMEQPRLSGFTKDQRAYEFIADAAAQTSAGVNDAQQAAGELADMGAQLEEAVGRFRV